MRGTPFTVIIFPLSYCMKAKMMRDLSEAAGSWMVEVLALVELFVGVDV
jgi:hypothetical protein